MKKRLIIGGLVMATAIVASLVVGQSVLAQGSAEPSMAGLPGVQIIVERGDEDWPSSVTEQFIYDRVESQLEGAGITVLSEAESDAHPARPYIYIRYTSLGEGTFTWEVQLIELVELFNGESGFATTWDEGGLGTGQREDEAEDVMGAIRRDVELFVEAWDATNRSLSKD